MKITKQISELILSDVTLRLKLALELGVTEQAVRNNVTRNNKNNLLTTHSAIKVMKRETGLKESELLTDKESFESNNI